MAFQKTLSEPQAAGPVQPDTSKAETIQLLGNVAQGAFEGYQTAGLKEELTSAAEELIAPLETDAADLAVQEAGKEMENLHNAKQAGRLSAGDFETRVSAITRKYIRRVPGMADKFRGIRSKLVGDYSAELRAVASSEKAVQKQQEKMKNMIYREAAKQNIDISQPFHDVAYEYQNRIGAIQEAEDYKLLESLEELNDKAKDREAKRRFDKASDGEFYTVIPEIKAIIGSDSDTAEKVFRLNNLKAERRALFNSKYDRVSVEKRNAKWTPIEGYIDNQIDFLNGKIQLDTAETSNKLIEQNALAGLNKHPGYPTTSVFLRRHPEVIASAFRTRGGIVAVQNAMDMLNSLYTGASPTLTTVEDKTAYTNIIKGVLKDIKDRELDIEVEGGIVPTFDKLLGEDRANRNIKNYDAFIDIMASPDMPYVLDNMPESEAKKSDYLDKINDYLVQEWSPRFRKDINEGLSQEFNVSKAAIYGGVDKKPLADFVNMEITENGKLLFRTQGLEDVSTRASGVINNKVKELNKRYAERFNKVVGARSNILGTNVTDEVAAIAELVLGQSPADEQPVTEQEQAQEQPSVQKLEPGIYQDEAGAFFKVTEEGEIEPYEPATR